MVSWKINYAMNIIDVFITEATKPVGLLKAKSV